MTNKMAIADLRRLLSGALASPERAIAGADEKYPEGQRLEQSTKDSNAEGYTRDEVKEKKAAILAALPDAFCDDFGDFGYKLGCALGKRAVIVMQPYRPENGQEFINLTVEQVVAALRS